MRLGRYVTQIAGSSLVTVLGLFLGVSPWLFGLNHGGPWSLATKTDFWSGMFLVVVGLTTLTLYRASLSQRLIALGYKSPPMRLDQSQEAREPDANLQEDKISDDQLLELATAILGQMPTSHEANHGDATSRAVAVLEEESSSVSEDQLIRAASQLLKELGTDESEAPKSEAEPDGEPLSLMSDRELARMAQELLLEIQGAHERERNLVTTGQEVCDE